MTRNLLDEFRINVLNSKLNPKTRDSFVFDDNSTSDKIYFFEYENYSGIRAPINLNSISISRIKGLIKENEIVCVIHKDSTQQDMIKRQLILISKNDENQIVKKLEQLQLNPFISIN